MSKQEFELQPVENNLHERNQDGSVLRTTLLGLGGVAALAGIGYAVYELNNDDNGGSVDKTSDIPTSEEISENCEDIKLANAAANPELYGTESFLPKADSFKTDEDVVNYIARLFDQDGPLAGDADAGSLAFVKAAITGPSHDGKTVDPAYNYLDAFKSAGASYFTENGNVAAKRDCKEANDTLVQLAELNNNWAQAGETVTKFVPIRDVDNADKSQRNNIIGLKLVKVVTKDKLSGIEVKLRDSSRELDGLTEVLLTDKGEAYVRGITIGEGQSVGLNGDKPQAVKPELNPKNNGESPFAGGSKTETEVDEKTGTVTTTGKDKNGNTIIEVTNPVNGDREVTVIPAGGGTPTKTTIPGTGPIVTIPGTVPSNHGTTPVATTLPPIRITTTTGVTVTTAPPTTRKPAPTTIPAPTTTKKPTPTTTPPPATTAPCPPGQDRNGPNGACKPRPPATTAYESPYFRQPGTKLYSEAVDLSSLKNTKVGGRI